MNFDSTQWNHEVQKHRKILRCIWFVEMSDGWMLNVIKVNNWKVFQISGFQKQHLYSETIFRWVGQGESPNYTSPKQEISMKLQRMRGVGRGVFGFG